MKFLLGDIFIFVLIVGCAVGTEMFSAQYLGLDPVSWVVGFVTGIMLMLAVLVYEHLRKK